MEDEQKKTFLEHQIKRMETLGFWGDLPKSIVLHQMELMYTTEILREWCIIDLVTNGNEVLVQHAKRVTPLTNAEVEEKYGRK